MTDAIDFDGAVIKLARQHFYLGERGPGRTLQAAALHESSESSESSERRRSALPPLPPLLRLPLLLHLSPILHFLHYYHTLATLPAAGRYRQLLCTYATN